MKLIDSFFRTKTRLREQAGTGAAIVIAVVLSAGCQSSSKVGTDYLTFVEELPTFGFPKPIKLSPENKGYLKDEGIYSVFRKSPGDAVRQLVAQNEEAPTALDNWQLVELIAAAADRMIVGEPREAIGWYTEVAELTLPWALGGDEHGGIDRNWALQYYNRSTARVARIIEDLGLDPKKSITVEGPLNTYRLKVAPPGPAVLDFDFFDEFRVPDEFRKANSNPQPGVKVDGFGGSLVGFRKFTKERDAETPFFPEFGLTLPITVTLEFKEANGSDREVEIVLHDILITAEDKLEGTTVTLTGDHESALELLNELSPTTRGFGRKAMLDPDRFLDTTGLLRTEPFRKDKIPVVLVHGLSKSPAVWGKAIAELRKDRRIRENYQFVAFRYPSGFSAPFAGRLLRDELKRFQQHYYPNRQLPAMERSVLIGKSYGGNVASLQVRESGDKYLKLFLNQPIDDLKVTEEIKADIRSELVFNPNQDINRVVFMVTPHLGTDVADKSIVNQARKLINELNLLEEERNQLIDSGGLTEYGEFYLNDRPSSVENLQTSSPILKTLAAMPFRDDLKIHSIIGNVDKGPLVDSHDKMVPYWSSHLDGVESELVVPTSHGEITYDPRSIAEIQRILLEHLDE